MAIGLKAVITTILGVAFIVAGIPVIIDQIQGVNTTAWTFTGYAGATAIWGLLGLAVVGGYVVKLVKGVMGK